MRLSTAQRQPRASRRAAGFTLVELLVSITLMAILLTVAVPSFNSWINNTRVRTVSETLQNGVRLAQAEAVRRNRTVVFFLTDDEPTDAAVAAENGRNWAIRTVAALGGEADEFVRGGSLADVAAGVTITGPAALCFSSAGQQLTIPAQGCATVAARYAVARTGADRNLRVDVSIGGRVRMCDPAKTLAADTPDGCEA